ncbi:sporulation integral membrane protein YtvI [Paenibacillus senegalensis]|uniref:sporulation integral membrane protein YtvI n=1 Tax=Paenibacillus senegalensis TaxID=1465766 RepID=UPI000288AF53|nr:sporulation integral membrane protein YtvI [Paenibacillus senegalensis]
MLTFYKKYYKTIFDIGLIILTIYLFMLLFSYLYSIAAPIFFALVIYAIIEPFAAYLNRKGLKKALATTISTVVFVLALLGVLTGLSAAATIQILNLIEKVPEYQEQVLDTINYVMVFLQQQVATIPQEYIERAGEYLASLVTGIGSLASAFLSGLYSGLTSVSNFMINFVIGLILAYFLSIEAESWKKAIHKHMPNTFKKAFVFLKENVLLGIAGYVKAQLKIISVTFVVIFIALLLLRVNNAFMIAFIAAIFDLLPLLGVSTIFIPWIIYLFIVGQTSLAIWLTAIWLLVIGTRQVLEPKITGDTLGVSAFTMLAFMIVSLNLFGFAGLILSPVLTITIKALMDQGYLQKWIRLPEDEYDDRPPANGHT